MLLIRDFAQWNDWEVVYAIAIAYICDIRFAYSCQAWAYIFSYRCMANLRQEYTCSWLQIIANWVGKKAELTFLSCDEEKEQRGRKPRGPFYPQPSIWLLLPPAQGTSFVDSLTLGIFWTSRRLLDILEYPQHKVFFGQVGWDEGTETETAGCHI